MDHGPTQGHDHRNVSKESTMSSPSLATRADTTHPAEALVVSVRTDERGARDAARWAEQLDGGTADAVVGSAARLEEQLDAASRVLVLDPSLTAAWRGFGARATSRERLRLVARLAGRSARVTWASTEAQAERWVRGGA
jgi:hypothetical protein